MGEVRITDVQQAVAGLRRLVEGLEPKYLSGEDAAEFVKAFGEGERLCGAGRTLAAGRVQRSGSWKSEGFRTAAQWVASTTGVSMGQAIGTLETARALEVLPATARAYASGELSEVRVKEVAAAAELSRESEGELLQAARTESLTSLKERCQQVKAAATDEISRYERIRRHRYLRHWTDPEGGFRLEARLTPDDGARVLAGLEPHRVRIFEEARTAGRRESSEAYAADALVAMAEAGTGEGCGSGSGTETGTGSGPGRPRAMIHVRVDHSALVRGHVEGGETCEISGIGPIPVATARALATDAYLRILVIKGADVVGVAHAGRTLPPRKKTAIRERDRCCVVPGCGTRHGLEEDHIERYADGGPTSLANMARLCKAHHALKTYHGYRLSGGPGNWIWSGPTRRPSEVLAQPGTAHRGTTLLPVVG